MSTPQDISADHRICGQEFLMEATYPQAEVRSIKIPGILSSLSLGKTRIVQP
jgi:hypothetical protein